MAPRPFRSISKDVRSVANTVDLRRTVAKAGLATRGCNIPLRRIPRSVNGLSPAARPRDIAKGLYADRVPAPRGHGILVNPIYGGQIVWNRVRMMKNPDTGRRVSRNNAPTDWVIASAPELAIVSPELFHAVQQRKAARAHTQRPLRQGKAPVFRLAQVWLLWKWPVGQGP